jgi:chemotaxis protein methyltransferase CheR
MIQASPDCVTERDFERISDLVFRHCGINLHDGKVELVRARIAKRLRLGSFVSARAYMDHVLADPGGEEFTELIDALSTNLTSFFRESGHFDFLAGRFLPALAERKRKQRTNRIRAWSAGCSTGEEPYSIAITLAESLGEGWDVRLLATDISTRVLRIARAGMYEKERVQPVPPASRNRYLTPNRIEGNLVFRVTDDLRRMVQFAYLNLMEPWPFTGPFDFIFCRNVMIYFDKPTQQKLVGRFWDCLDSGGLLFTGHSESLTGITHRFRYVQPTIYVKA